MIIQRGYLCALLVQYSAKNNRDDRNAVPVSCAPIYSKFSPTPCHDNSHVMTIECCTYIPSFVMFQRPALSSLHGQSRHPFCYGLLAVLRATQLHPLELHSDRDDGGGNGLAVC